MIYGHVPLQVIRNLAFLLASLLPLISFAQNAVSGNMDCVVTGNVVISSEEGKFKQYSGFKEGIQTGDRATLEYRVADYGVYVSLGGKLNERTIVNLNISNSNKLVTVPTKVKGFHIANEYEKIWITEDYIVINTQTLGELSIKRYYKNDWHGIYSYFDMVGMSSQIATINCRHTKDEINNAYDIFLRSLNKNK